MRGDFAKAIQAGINSFYQAYNFRGQQEQRGVQNQYQQAVMRQMEKTYQEPGYEEKLGMQTEAREKSMQKEREYQESEKQKLINRRKTWWEENEGKIPPGYFMGPDYGIHGSGKGGGMSVGDTAKVVELADGIIKKHFPGGEVADFPGRTQIISLVGQNRYLEADAKVNLHKIISSDKKFNWIDRLKRGFTYGTVDAAGQPVRYDPQQYLESLLMSGSSPTQIGSVLGDMKKEAEAMAYLDPTPEFGGHVPQYPEVPSEEPSVAPATLEKGSVGWLPEFMHREKVKHVPQWMKR